MYSRFRLVGHTRLKLFDLQNRKSVIGNSDFLLTYQFCPTVQKENNRQNPPMPWFYRSSSLKRTLHWNEQQYTGYFDLHLHIFGKTNIKHIICTQQQYNGVEGVFNKLY